MDIKQETKDILTNPPADMPYICLMRKTPGNIRCGPAHMEYAFILQETGTKHLYIGNIFAFMEGSSVPTEKRYDSIDAIIADGWEVD